MSGGSLFTQEFLKRGIKETPEWRALSQSDVDLFRDGVRDVVERFTKQRAPSEQRTEDELIWKILQDLGWQHWTRQVPLSARGREAVPDGLLFADASEKDAADSLGTDPRAYEHGLAIVESKRWQRQLDRKATGGHAGEIDVPSSQMLRYLRRVDDLTKGGVRWGILTNGRFWRLYFQGARSVSEDFFEVDLARLVRAEGFDPTLFDGQATDGDPDHDLKVFILFFRRSAFLAERTDGRTFHQLSLDEGRRWEALITERLSEAVFDSVFPDLVEAIGYSDPEAPAKPDESYLAEVKHAALVFLYRLLFVLYAEDRDLLPFRDKRYDDYGLDKEIREKIANRRDQDDTFAAEVGPIHNKLKILFRIIDRGAASIGIPPYNGGLFSRGLAPTLDRIEIPDNRLAPIVDRMSRDLRSDERHRINYRDLSVQHLGSIYERLLENRVGVAGDGSLEVTSDERARKGSGSYYTNEHAVQLIIDQAVGPLLRERMQAFMDAVDRLRRDKRPVENRIEELKRFDPAVSYLEIKVCDPAMGSGHFLVSLVDYLATQTLAATAEAEAAVDWAPADQPYQSPLSDRIADIRDHILSAAKRNNWGGVTEQQLDDRQIVRRMILKRVVHGVDKNEMAVELAKVSLWLHTFTVGAPLSFLEHHLRVGDSISGARVRDVVDRLETHGHQLLIKRSIDRAIAAAEEMTQLERLSDTDISEVSESQGLYQTVEDQTTALKRFLDFMHALHWLLDAVTDKTERHHRWTAVQALLDGQFGNPIRVVAGDEVPEIAEPAAPDTQLPGMGPAPKAEQGQLIQTKRDRETWNILSGMLDEARKLATREGFLHWEPTFPNIWKEWQSKAPHGGFDAVIGNPPYVRGEKLGELKRYLKAAYRTYHGQADLYVYFYELGLRLLKPGGRLSYIVTNKWLRAGYAEDLRKLFGEQAWMESILDFGHAKQFFPDADVFPCVITARRPTEKVDAPQDTKVAVIPRDEVRLEDLPNQVERASFPAPRLSFGANAWRLEPPEVNALLDKIAANGTPLKEVVGASPYYGIKTGYNQAFLIDTAKKDELIARDPRSADIIKPYLRGQDIDRWVPDWQGLWMIAMASSGDRSWPWSKLKDEAQAEKIFARELPALHAHVKLHEQKLRTRQDQGHFWWELRSCGYYETMKAPKIFYQDIMWRPEFCLDDHGYFSNNTAYFLPTADPWLACVLNSPLAWWYSWRTAQHGKDEALRFFTNFLKEFPIAAAEPHSERATQSLSRLLDKEKEQKEFHEEFKGWLSSEFGVTKTIRKISTPERLSEESFVKVVKEVIGKRTPLSSSAVKALRDEHARTIKPAQKRAAEIARLEREISDLVNAAYGLSDDEVALMWRTAPPRMPLAE